MAEQEYQEVLDYDDNISEEELAALMQQAEQARDTNMNASRTLNSFAEDRRDGNFLHLQISTEQMLDQLEHFYRGDVKKYINGQVEWEKQENKDLVTFNDYGVNSLMEIVTKYIDRNTILSSYSEERIYEILGDLGDELALFILCNYKQLGMDTYFKKTKYRLVVVTTLHTIESTYRRAIKGKTLEEMNQSRVIGQFGDPRQAQIPMQKKRGFFARNFSP